MVKIGSLVVEIFGDIGQFRPSRSTILIFYPTLTHRPLRYQKRGPDRSSAPKMLSFCEKIAKIGPADSEIICLREIIKKDDEKKKKKKEIYASKIYSPVGNLAERAK